MIPDYQLDITAKLSGVEVDVEVGFRGGWRIPAVLSGSPDSWAPEEGEDPEIIYVKVARTKENIVSKLSREELDSLIARCWNYQRGVDQDARQAYLDNYYDDEPSCPEDY